MLFIHDNDCSQPLLQAFQYASETHMYNNTNVDI